MPRVLVTGANRGLGLEFVRQYAADGWHVTACCRHPGQAKALAEMASRSDGRVKVHQVDLADMVRIEGLAAELTDVPIDVLINCAGTLGKYSMDDGAIEKSRFGTFDADEWLNVYKINVMAPMKLSEALIKNVEASEQKKIITLTSELGSIGTNSVGGFYAYRASKSAVNSIMKNMAVDLKNRGIVCVPLHPGWVRTDMGGSAAPVDAEASVTGMRNVIAGLTPAKSGHYLTFEGKELPW